MERSSSLGSGPDSLSLDARYLIPLRWFIGVGWLRAFAEKVIEPGWREGTELGRFLSDHVATGAIPFPFYESLARGTFSDHVVVLAWIVMLAELLVGAALLTGTLTQAAILGDIFMNINFILVGEPTPSIFYIPIQVVVLASHSGAILGIDRRLSRVITHPLLTAQPRLVSSVTTTSGNERGANALPVLFVSLIGVAFYALIHVRDFSPAGSVHDPAMVLVILTFIGMLWCGIAYPQAARERISLALPSFTRRVHSAETTRPLAVDLTDTSLATPSRTHGWHR